jgi:hypothetical protein
MGGREGDRAVLPGVCSIQFWCLTKHGQSGAQEVARTDINKARTPFEEQSSSINTLSDEQVL